MKTIRSIVFFVIAIFSSLLLFAKIDPTRSSNNFVFIENKGQIKNQNSEIRDDIQFVLKTDDLAIFIGNGEVHYQFSKKGTCNSLISLFANDEIARNLIDKTRKEFNSYLSSQSQSIYTYRIDMNLLDANKNCEILAEEIQPYYENYFLSNCPITGIKAHSYKKITYKNIYNGIDWVLFIEKDKLEYSFIVSDGADATKIKMKYSGQDSIKIEETGKLKIGSPIGELREMPPYSFDKNGSILQSHFSLSNGTVGFEVADCNQLFVIDPVLEWGTYFGIDSSATFVTDMAVDDSANIYACGSTYSSVPGSIATTGSYQYTYAGNSDAFIVKFDSSGNRLWGTYFGGSGLDWASVIILDHIGNIYLAGYTNSDSCIATSGTQESYYMGGQWDGFLAKFTTGGIKEWGTYVGGDIGPAWDNEITSLCLDNFNHLYLSGACDDTSNIATPGCWKYHKTGGVDHYDCYLIQYDTSGIERWGTYYGGNQNDIVGASCTDGINVYLAGHTSSDTGIASVGSYQPYIYNSNPDCFIAKFDSSGNRIWGTYYGGEGQEETGGITFVHNYLFLLGSTSSDTSIASPGCFQPLRGGVFDAFLTKFNTSGTREWGTYYGGPNLDRSNFGTIANDNLGNIYISGYTNSVTGIASPCAGQEYFAGGDYDAFLAKYDAAGTQIWATYYGGNGSDRAWACASDGKGAYLCGNTTSTNNIATPGSFLDTGGGLTLYSQGFIAKFIDPSPDTFYGTTHVCVGHTTTLNNNRLGGTWSSSNTAIATIGASTGIVSGISTGIITMTYSFFADCYFTISDTVLNCSVLTYDTKAESDFDIFPNPVVNELHFSDGIQIQKIVLYDLFGREILRAETNNKEIEKLDLEYLPSGIYYLKLNESQIRKISKM